MRRKFIIRTTSAILFVAIGLFFFFHNEEQTTGARTYQTNSGHIFGTYYRITYRSDTDLHDKILIRLQAFDASLSMFNQRSLLSRINRNENVTTDADFERMFRLAQEVSALSNGAFDITVAPLVNAWGFGFKNKENITPTTIDSLMQYVGYKKAVLFEHHIYKEHKNVMLDAGAIAKGQGCDVVADLLREHGCEHFLVDIGGEVVCQGQNSKGEHWKVAIVKPQDDPIGASNDLQEILSAPQLAMATSGNYRQFYYENGTRRSHTIDPRTGYPVTHNLLSATVIAPTCMQADAFATACMVLGTDEAMAMINEIDSVECYLIHAAGDTLSVTMTEGMKAYIQQIQVKQ